MRRPRHAYRRHGPAEQLPGLRAALLGTTGFMHAGAAPALNPPRQGREGARNVRPARVDNLSAGNRALLSFPAERKSLRRVKKRDRSTPRYRLTLSFITAAGGSCQCGSNLWLLPEARLFTSTFFPNFEDRNVAFQKPRELPSIT